MFLNFRFEGGKKEKRERIQQSQYIPRMKPQIAFLVRFLILNFLGRRFILWASEIFHIDLGLISRMGKICKQFREDFQPPVEMAIHEDWHRVKQPFGIYLAMLGLMQ